MKIKLSETTPLQINYLVAKCQGVKLHPVPQSGVMEIHFSEPNGCATYQPSTDWAQGGPIIEREKIELKYLGYDNPPYWGALKFSPSSYERKKAIGPTPLIAAMRCFVASQLGNEIEVPDGLI